MLQCFSGLYSALFDKSCQKERKKPNIIPRPACSYLAAGKNEIPTYKLRSLRLLLNLAATFNSEKFVGLEVVEDGGEVAVIQRQYGFRAVCILGLSG